MTSGIYAPPLETRPGFGVSLAIKDAEHALSLAKRVDARLPGVEIAHGNMQSARDYAGECLDSSSMYGILRMEAGMSFWNDASQGEDPGQQQARIGSRHEGSTQK